MKHINLMIVDNLFSLVKMLSVVEEYYEDSFYITKNLRDVSPIEYKIIDSFITRLLKEEKVNGLLDFDDLMKISYNHILISNNFDKDTASKLLVTRFCDLSFVESGAIDYLALSDEIKRKANRSHYDYEVLFKDSILYLSKPEWFTKPRCYSTIKPIHISNSIIEILKRDFLDYEEVLNADRNTPIIFLDSYFDYNEVYEYVPAVYHYLEDMYEKNTIIIKYCSDSNKKIIPRNINIIDCDYKMPNELLNCLFTGKKYVFDLDNVLLSVPDLGSIQLLKIDSDNEAYNEKIGALFGNNFNGLQIKEI